MDTTEETYEKLVDAMERRTRNVREAEAKSAYRNTSGSAEERHQAAHDAVFEMLLADTRWERVEAADISDIAYADATDAEREIESEDL